MQHFIPNCDEIENYIGHQLDEMWRKIFREFPDAEMDDVRIILKDLMENY